MWNDLSMTEKAQLIAIGVQSGITDINTIRNSYNSLADGGDTENNYQEVPYNNLPEVVVEPPVWYRNYRDRLPKKVHENIRDYLTSEYGNKPEYYDEVLHRLEDVLSISRATVTDKTNVGNTFKRAAESLGIPYHIGYNNPQWNPVFNSIYNLTPSNEDTFFRSGKYAPPIEEQVFNSLVAELAHPIQEKYGKDDEWDFYTSDNFQKQYDTPGYLEYETHKVIEPKLLRYIYDGETFGNTTEDNLMDSILRAEGLYKPELIHNVDREKLAEKARYMAELKRKRKEANTFDDGGYTTPWWNKLYYQLTGSNTYETPTLKEAIFKAIHNGDKGNPIIWNGNVYKAELNREDSEEYRNEIIKYNDLINGIYDRSSASPITELLLEGETLDRGKIKEGRLQNIDKEFSKYPTSPNTSYEDAIKWAENNGYIDYMLSQGRAIQKGRVLEAANQDPVQSERDYIPLKDTYSKKTAGTVFDLSTLRYNPDLIDIIANNLPEGYDIYKALTLPIVETSLGQGYKRTNLSSNLGYVRSLINNHDYELNLGYFNDVAQYVRNVWQKGDGNISDLIKEVYNIDTFKKNHPDLYKRMNDDAKEKFSEKVWAKNNNEYTPVEDSYMKHALKQLKDGKYNTGNSDYKTRVDRIANILKTSTELNDYLKSNGYIK